MAKGKIIVMRLFGGLGNQLFQYAFLFALSRQGGKARLEASSYEHDDKRVCELHHFRVSLPIEGGPPPWAFRKSRIPACLRSLFAAPKYPHFREEKRHGFDPGLAAPPRRHTYFKRYFQTEQYFLHCREQLCREFRLKTPHARGEIYRSLPFLPSGPRVPGRENSRTAPAPSRRPAGTANGTGTPQKPPRTMKFPDVTTTPPVPASPEKSRIPVMFSATGGWGLPLSVAIHTLCLHAGSGRFYDIHIVHDGMDARIIQELNRVAAPFPQVSLSFLQLPEQFRQLFQNGNKNRYSPLAYARLMAGSLFPQYGRIVYLDADTLLAGDVAELYFSNLRGAPAAAAGDGLALWSIEEGTMHPHLEYMGSYLSSPLSYCNSGVLVLDLDQMRRRNLEHRLLQQLRSRPEPFPYPDQDILNIALHGDITPLPPEWNFQFLSWTWDEERIQRLRGTEFENVPSISCGHAWKLLHMVGPEKPWRLPDAPGTIGQFHWILYSFFWWQEAKKLPAFRKELDAISRGLAPLLRRHIRSQQWKLFFSRGHIFRRRRDRIRWLKKVLSILDGRKL